jgi:hypothetical protein
LAWVVVARHAGIDLKNPSLRIYVNRVVHRTGKTAFNFFLFSHLQIAVNGHVVQRQPGEDYPDNSNEPVFYFNKSTRECQIGIGPSADSTQLHLPPFMSYEVPYYYSKFTNNNPALHRPPGAWNYYITLSDAPSQAF